MKSFYSKVLLFGEYSVIQNSLGLSIPYELFEGQLTFKRERSEHASVDPELKAFAEYMRVLIKQKDAKFAFDVTSFAFDVAQGLRFDSSIPQGHGVGSSGALCAALFDRYGKIIGRATEEEEIPVLKDIFAQLESHFHGASSGIDPLISYLNRPLLIKGKNDLGIVCIPEFKHGQGGMFLLNTGRARRTEPLVNLFLEKLKDREFKSLFHRQLLPINDHCIHQFLAGNTRELLREFKKLSDFQYHHFTAMIPKLCMDIWHNGLVNDQYYLKLCGAGGGGFILGISKDFERTQEQLSKLGQHEIRPLFHF